MQYLAFAILVGLVFLACFGVDKGFTRLFRNKKQHRSGLAVRANRRYGSIGMVVLFFGAAGLLSGLGGQILLVVAGIVLLAVGVGLIVYYLSFGVYYDEDTMLLCVFGKREREYRFQDILGQKLYRLQGGGIFVELYLTDGQTVHIQPGTMEGTEAFLSHAYAAWQRQKGLSDGDCPFHDPSNSIWFPTMEDT